MRHSSSLIETYLARPAYWLTSSRLVQKVIIIGVGVGVEAARTGQRRVWLWLQCACRELEYLWFWIWIRPPKWAFVAHLCVCVCLRLTSLATAEGRLRVRFVFVFVSGLAANRFLLFMLANWVWLIRIRLLFACSSIECICPRILATANTAILFICCI